MTEGFLLGDSLGLKVGVGVGSREGLELGEILGERDGEPLSRTVTVGLVESDGITEGD